MLINTDRSTILGKKENFKHLCDLIYQTRDQIIMKQYSPCCLPKMLYITVCKDLFLSTNQLNHEQQLSFDMETDKTQKHLTQVSLHKLCRLTWFGTSENSLNPIQHIALIKTTLKQHYFTLKQEMMKLKYRHITFSPTCSFISESFLTISVNLCM